MHRCTAQRNGYYGIYVARGSARDNLADVNGIFGISVMVGSIADNVATRNSYGLILYPGTSYVGNALIDNAFNVSGGGINLGHNQCGTTACP